MKKVISCLSVIQIELGILYFQLLSLTTEAQGAMMGAHVGSVPPS